MHRIDDHDGRIWMTHAFLAIVDACLTQADGHAVRHAALAMIEKHADRPRAIKLGADKGGACPRA